MGNDLLSGCCSKDDQESNEKDHRLTTNSSLSNEVTIPAAIIETKENIQSDLPICKKEENQKESIENSNNVFDKYEKINKLEDGFYGSVYKVQNKENGLFCALKEINKSLLLNSGKKGKKLKKEIENLKNVDNINIAKFYDFFEDQNNYYLLSEFCNNGDLEEKAKNGVIFCEFMVKVIMYKIFNAIDYLHKQNISHSDIKKSNIGIIKINNDNNENIPSIKELINEISKNEKMQNELIEKSEISKLSKESKIFLKNLSYYDIKLLDFGIMDIFKLVNFEEMLCITSTLSYISPEFFSNKDGKEKDEWACGALMYILLTGNNPFDGDTKEEVINEIKNKNLDLNIKSMAGKSRNCKDLIFKLLSKDPKLRITAQEALEHNFFKYGILISDINENIEITGREIEIKNVRIKKEKIIEEINTDIPQKKQVEEVKVEKEEEKQTDNSKHYSYRRHKTNTQENEKKEEEKKEEESSSKRSTYRRKRGEESEKKEEERKEEESSSKKNTYRRKRGEESEKKEEEKKEEESSSKKNTYRKKRGEESDKKENKKEDIKIPVSKSANNDIKKEIIEYITSIHISRRGLYKLKEVIDKLSNGNMNLKIDKNTFIENFKAAFKDFTDNELDNLFEEIKDKKTGNVDCQTLANVFSTREKLINAAVIKKAYDAFDSFGSGNLTWDKIYTQIFRGKKENEFDNFIQSLGYKSKNDKVSLEGFIKALK